jgi:hypothetical protein
MPYHTSKAKMPMKSKAKPKPKKSNKLKKLTQKQKDQLSKLSKSHSKKHMAVMRMLVMRGASMKKAHDQAVKKVGM